MPNNFLTIGFCSPDYEKLGENRDIDDIDFEELNGVDLAEKVLKMPEELNGIISGSQPYRFKHRITGKLWEKDCNGPFLEKDYKDWIQVYLTEEEKSELIKKYGASNWYDWNRINRGTKWGTYGTKFRSLGGDGSPKMIEFQTAWSPVNKVCLEKIEEYLNENYFLTNFYWTYHDPYDGRYGKLEDLYNKKENT